MAHFTSIRVFAPAKVNLTLHVTGQRSDGYHLLDSLVAFADVGDELLLHRGGDAPLVTQGPEAGQVPADENNLVAQVAALFQDLPDVCFSLTKNLPVASGIGGGSADAAAAYRGLMRFRHDGDAKAALFDPSHLPMAREVLALGADIPMCLLSVTARIRGIGDQIAPLPDLPPLHAVLVNPRCGVSTPAVFRTLASRSNPPMPEELPAFSGPGDLIAWLAEQRNDMEAAALRLEPAIASVKQALNATGQCRLARMSGSGATCFGLYDTKDHAHAAAQDIRKKHPDWWIKATHLGPQSDAVLPRLS